MKRADLGIVTIHWMLVVVLLGAAASGLCLWDERLRPYMASVFPMENIGVVHIGASMAVVAILLAYFVYLKHKNFNIAIRKPVVDGKVIWKRVNILVIWILFSVIGLETISGILLTKLVNQDVLARVFLIEKGSLVSAHLYLVFAIFAFPVVHVAVHWLDGRVWKVLSIFRPRIFPRRPTLVEVMARLKQENIRLKEKIGDH